MNQTLFQIEENTVLSGPLVDIQVPQGQQVTFGPLTTPHAFRIQGNQLFLNVTPDYEVRCWARWPLVEQGSAHRQ